MSYDEAIRALDEGVGDSRYDPDVPWVMGPMAKNEIERLVSLADPKNDVSGWSPTR